MIINDKNIKNLFAYWLYFSLILVFLIIIIGGLTRLTNSGLSITEWELFTGILPPMNSVTWDFYFNQYKKIPQYKLINYNMTMYDFKVIFYWEYVHRILARLIGLFFLIPLIYFHFSKKIEKEYIYICYAIFFLIVLQGTIGWYMVKSGLTNDITVSHYKLSLHLVIALVIISSIFWVIKNLQEKKRKYFFNFSRQNLFFFILIFLVFTQIILGAFVSGLDAGRIYQTWPLMGKNYFPDDISLRNIESILDFNNHSLVQFYHRNLAYIITFYLIGLSLYIMINKIKHLYKPLLIMISFIILQIILGILTLVSGLNMYLASAHQITSVILVFSAINLYYFRTK